MQVYELPDAPALQRGLQRGDVDLELAPRRTDPQVAAARQLLRQRLELAELVAADVEDAHQPPPGRHKAAERPLGGQE
jgi:hypothetical protein